MVVKQAIMYTEKLVQIQLPGGLLEDVTDGELVVLDATNLLALITVLMLLTMLLHLVLKYTSSRTGNILTRHSLVHHVKPRPYIILISWTGIG